MQFINFPSLLTAMSVIWGDITGTLSDQTDLQAALDSKLDGSGNAGNLAIFHDSDTLTDAQSGGNANSLSFADTLNAPVLSMGCPVGAVTLELAVGSSSFGPLQIISTDTIAQILTNTANLVLDIGGSGPGAFVQVTNNLRVDGNLGVGNSAPATLPGTVTNKIEIFDEAGVSLGFIAVYDAIT